MTISIQEEIIKKPIIQTLITVSISNTLFKKISKVQFKAHKFITKLYETH